MGAKTFRLEIIRFLATFTGAFAVNISQMPFKPGVSNERSQGAIDSAWQASAQRGGSHRRRKPA
ncbi:hypothetical protein EMIT0P43_20050 [Pseudomonas jessenii]